MESRARLSIGIVLLTLTTIAGCRSTPELRGFHPAITRVESTISTISSGTVEAEQQAVLGFGISGRVAHVAVQLGSRVRRGQILAELENKELQIVAEDARVELERNRELFQSGLVSQVALDTARKNFEVAKANLQKTVMKAPFDGVITELNLEMGELAQMAASPATSGGKSQVRLIDLRPRRIRGEIDEVDLAKVKIGNPARVRILALGKDYQKARVSQVVPFVSTTKEQDRTSQIELRLTDTHADQVVPVGASADIEVVVAAKDKALAVPSRAILGMGTGATQRYVFKWENKRLNKTLIQTGIGNYDRTEIISGLTDQDVVVFPSDEVELKDQLKVRVELTPWP